MPVKRQIQYLQHDLSTGAYEFILPSTKSWEVLEIGAIGLGAGQGINCNIDGVASLFIPAITDIIGIAAPPWTNVNMRGFYEQLMDRFEDIPRLIIGAGEKFTITRQNTATACIVKVWYKEIEAPDLLDPASLGGSKNSTKIFNSYIRGAGAIPASGQAIVPCDVVLNPPGYRNFPINELVQKGFEYDFLGMVIYPDMTDDAINLSCDGVRIWHQNESILGQDEDFVYVDTFPIQGAGLDSRLFLLPEPRVFKENERMDVELQYSNADAVNPHDVINHVGLIFRVRPV